MAEFRFTVNTEQMARTLRTTRDILDKKVVDSVEKLSVAAHAFIINKANAELQGFKRESFLGLGDKGKKAAGKSSSNEGVDQSARNVRWVRVANGLWVVEIDESASWIEDGRPETSMATEDWLLKPGKTKRAKDGSLYRSIPFRQTEGNKGTNYSKPAFTGMIFRAMQEQGIHRTRVDRNPDGSPKLGKIANLNIKEPEGGAGLFPGFYSRPRTLEEAAATGLKPHGGNFMLQGAQVIQRRKENKRGRPGKVVKETVVFRTVSSKHQAEHRWMYPEVKPFGAIPAAYKWANEQWEKIVKEIEEDIRRAGGS